MATLTVNGRERDLGGDGERSLLRALREDLDLIGAKGACGEGACGACTVLADGEAVRSCVTPLRAVAGRRVTTVEGLATGGQLHAVQRAFVELGALQCGFCTPGMIMSAAALLARTPNPTDDDIRAGLDGNVCRCGAYPRIAAAVRRAAEVLRRARAEAPTLREAGARLSSPAPLGGAAAPPAAAAASAAAGARPSGADGAVCAVGDAPAKRPWDLTPPDERDFHARLGDGLMVVLPPEPGRRGGPGGFAFPHGGAWLHVGADGRVHAFIGKVEVGQGTQIALALLVAEELRVPLDAVRVVMGDTDFTPWDIGTFGSRSMPDAGEHLRQAAAGAHRILLALAAERLSTTPDGLDSADGRVTVRGSDGVRASDGVRGSDGGGGSGGGGGGVGSGSGGSGVGRGGGSLGYGDLVRGLRRVETVPGDEPTSAPASWCTAGVATRAATAVDAVTGARRFVSDLRHSGMLLGHVLRPPAHGATLRAADVSRAAAMPGVTVVNEGGLIAVAAEDPAVAAAALRAVRADWDETPQPSEKDTPAFLRAHPTEGEGFWGAVHEAVGDVDGALAGAAVTLDATYTTAYIAHVPLECRCALAAWVDGRLHVWTGTQQPFGVREEIAEAMGVPQGDVRVVVPPTGTGFGGKHTAETAIAAARLARKSGRPVKVLWTREEEQSWAYFRPMAVIDVRAGLDAGGRLLGWDFRNVNAGSAALMTPYQVAHRRHDHQPSLSPLPQGPYRSLSAAANVFARESHMDELAVRAGVDPLDFRLRHLGDERLAAVFRAAALRAGWAPRGSVAGRGLGIAGAVEKGGRVATCAEVAVSPDGHVTVARLVSAFECGAIVNPDNLGHQVEGAAVMALGGALFEAIHFDGGRILNPRLSQYRVPRFSDVPPIEIVLIDRRDVAPAGGGETPLVAVAPAIANAIFAATGRRLRALPLVPDGVVPPA